VPLALQPPLLTGKQARVSVPVLERLMLNV
jgi:hypothetical protein